MVWWKYTPLFEKARKKTKNAPTETIVYNKFCLAFKQLTTNRTPGPKIIKEITYVKI